jgi:hypothetical protein
VIGADNYYIGIIYGNFLYCILGNCVGSVGRCCVTFTVVRWGYCTGISLCKMAVFHLLSFIFNNHWHASLVVVNVVLYGGLCKWLPTSGVVCPPRFDLSCAVHCFVPSRL